MSKIINPQNNDELIEFAESVKKGAIFAYPTEAVFGLGCDINNKHAIQKILDIKRRDISKGLIVISDNLEKVRNLIDDDYFKIFVEENSGSNPTTWLCPVSNLVLPEVTGDSKKIAIRITKHDTSRTICKVLDMPIISTSANIAGKEPATKQDELKFFFGDIDYIIEGEVGNNKKPSRIIDLISKEVIREGG